MPPGMILQTARPHFWNHCLIFVSRISLMVEPRWMLGLRVSIMSRSLLSLQMVLRKQRPVLAPWKQLSLVLPCLVKMFYHTQMTWWMIPPRSRYLMKVWVAQQRWRWLTLHLRWWAEEFHNLHQKGKCETELRNSFFFLWNFAGYRMIHANVGAIRDPVKQDFEFCRKQNKDISTLTETHINYDQIHQIRNNWLDPIFLSPGNINTKELLAQLHPSLEGVTDPKGWHWFKRNICVLQGDSL